MIGPIALDPCPSPFDVVCAGRQPESGLSAEWIVPRGEVVYVNPPYGRGKITPFVERFRHYAPKARVHRFHIVLLAPSRTDTQWFDVLTEQCDVVCFLRGRLRFARTGQPAPAPAPFPSVLVYAGPEPGRFMQVFAARGSFWERTCVK